MAANGVNSNDDSEITECDGEKVVTMMDVLQEQQDFEDDANAVLGASDDKNCTYSKGYVKRQAIYACLTCCADAKNDETKRAGVCLACSLNCHENHDLVELYTKRNFRCDCGNPKFNSHPCQFTPNKNDLNENNKYNHNFAGIYCVCERPYPDPEALEEDEMIQCIICEDWLHSAHLESSVPSPDQYAEMICKGCMQKNEFLQDYSDLAVISENVDVDVLTVNPEPSIVSVETIRNDKEILDENEDTTKVNEQNTDVEMNNDNLELSDEKVLQNIEAVLDNNSSDNEIASKNDEKSENASLETVAIANGDTALQEDLLETPKIFENGNKSPIIEEENKAENEVNVENEKSSDEQIESKDVENIETNASLETVAVNNGDEVIVHDSNGNPKLLENTEESSVNDEESEIVKNNLEQDMNNLQQDNTAVSEAELTENLSTALENSANLINLDKPKENINDEQHSTTDVTEDAGLPIVINEAVTVTEISDTDKPVTVPEISDTDKPVTVPEISDTDKSGTEINNDEGESNHQLEVQNDKHEEMDVDSTEVTGFNEKEETVLETNDVGEDKSEPEMNRNQNSESNCNEIEEQNEKLIEMDVETNKVNESINKEETELDTNEEINKIDEFQDKTPEKEIEQDDKADINKENNETNESSNILKEDNEEVSMNIEGYTVINGSSLNAVHENDLKRKSDEENVSDAKKPKLNLSSRGEGCIRPIGTKKPLKGATFWPNNFRQKLCTCNECLTMYKDLSVLFLTDPEDTVTAYETLGQENTPSSQYERGLEALSSLDRVQQINALTEYNKMRDKLLDFLKSFKDRKEVVKEEDIKAFFAGMKPKREPDGVYFCR